VGGLNQKFIRPKRLGKGEEDLYGGKCVCVAEKIRHGFTWWQVERERERRGKTEEMRNKNPNSVYF
jgi:hypothetical protein